MIKIIIVLTSFFSCFYFDNKNWLNKKIDLVPFVHSFIQTVITNSILIYNPTLYLNYKEQTEIVYILPLLVGFGYSLYELYNSIKDKKFEYIIHGLIIFLIGCVGFLTTENISPFCNYAFMTETSTFFLNLRPLKIAMIDFGFIGTFIFYRLVLFPWITYYYIDNLYAKMLGIGFFTLNLYWFVLIAKKSYKTYLKGKAT